MNKIFRKCREFGLMVRLPLIDPSESLNIVRSLKKGNIPLCIVNADYAGWEKQLNKIAFNEDLFIAAENINNIETAYTAVANGAQFFILNSSDKQLMLDLKSNGFTFIPKVSNKKELSDCIELNVEVINPESNFREYSLPSIRNYSENYRLKNNQIFEIINLPVEKNINYEDWINSIRKKQLNLNYTKIYLSTTATDLQKEFVSVFSSTNKISIIEDIDNLLILSTNDFTRTANYLKWQEIYFDPDSAVIKDDKIVEAILDKELCGIKIKLMENNNEY